MRMVFCCHLVGSEVETLAWNIRNNYEVAVDSFGTLWQSDNDDDGNRGVRINYVMERGNYGYADEMTGAGWQAKRSNMEEDIPHRHWHQNDPGVMPNLLLTGAGSPTGMAIYEGKLLPEIFRNQMIHADAGPRVVRAYPVKPDGAGYQAEIAKILEQQKRSTHEGAGALPAGAVEGQGAEIRERGVERPESRFAHHGVADCARGKIGRDSTRERAGQGPFAPGAPRMRDCATA